jgi:hypothetical protein
MSGLSLRWQTFGRHHHPRAVDLTADPIGRVPLRRQQEVTVGPQRDRRVEWPNLAATTCSGTSASKASVAEVCRRSCSRMLGNPVAATVRVNRAVGDCTQRARVSHVTHKQVTT